MSSQNQQDRARVYAALGDVSRLTIVDLLAHGDLAPGELSARLDLPTNLLAHHLRILEEVGLVSRRRSEGDGRRSYVMRTPACNALLSPSATPLSLDAAGPKHLPHRVAFVCSQNSARSQLAESCWRRVSDLPVVSAGLHPARRVHPRAVAVAHQHGLDLSGARTKLACDAITGDELVITVCDRAHEDLPTAALHWSVPDPVRVGTPAAFEEAFNDIADRVASLATSMKGQTP